MIPPLKLVLSVAADWQHSQNGPLQLNFSNGSSPASFSFFSNIISYFMYISVGFKLASLVWNASMVTTTTAAKLSVAFVTYV